MKMCAILNIEIKKGSNNMRIRKDILARILETGRLDTSTYRYIVDETSHTIERIAIKDLDTIRAYEVIDYFSLDGSKIN